MVSCSSCCFFPCVGKGGVRGSGLQPQPLATRGPLHTYQTPQQLLVLLRLGGALGQALPEHAEVLLHRFCLHGCTCVPGASWV